MVNSGWVANSNGWHSSTVRGSSVRGSSIRGSSIRGSSIRRSFRTSVDGVRGWAWCWWWGDVHRLRSWHTDRHRVWDDLWHLNNALAGLDLWHILDVWHWNRVWHWHRLLHVLDHLPLHCPHHLPDLFHWNWGWDWNWLWGWDWNWPVHDLHLRHVHNLGNGLHTSLALRAGSCCHGKDCWRLHGGNKMIVVSTK